MNGVEVSKQIEAMKLALEALEQTLKTLENENKKPNGAIADTIWYSGHETLFDYLASQITALREALAEQPAQQEHFDHKAAANAALRDAQNRSYQVAKSTQPAQQEPKFWVVRHKDQKLCDFFYSQQEADEWATQFNAGWVLVEPLYTAPQAQPAREPLTVAQIREVLYKHQKSSYEAHGIDTEAKE